ncbi:MAG: NADH-ubiquinone oxidoreductase-F iron-sulfur binding region domain-containing protein [Myxococcota bacterium]
MAEEEGFYDFLHRQVEIGVCAGTTCRFEGGPEIDTLHADAALHEVHCLSRCYEAPNRTDTPTAPVPRSSLVYPPVVLRRVLDPPPAHAKLGCYCLPEEGEEILDRVASAGLRERCGGGATAERWRAARDGGEDHVVVANTVDGGPGAFVDRLLLEEDPHAVLAGMLAAGRAVGATEGVVWVRDGYGAARRAVEGAIEEARRAGCLGEDFDISVAFGGAAHLAGDDRITRVRRLGLAGVRPTVVHCIETLAVVPWVVRRRARCDTRAISLSGAVRRPGLVEVALGTSLASVLDEGGRGAPPGTRWKMALVGGPTGRIIPRSAFDTPLTEEALPGFGHGGVLVLADDVSARDVARHLFRYAESESCGQCVPCRIGTSQLAEALSRDVLEGLLETLEVSSLCEFGQSVPQPIHDLLVHFGEEMYP